MVFMAGYQANSQDSMGGLDMQGGVLVCLAGFGWRAKGGL
jgi:hypothetical protein